MLHAKDEQQDLVWQIDACPCRNQIAKQREKS